MENDLQLFSFEINENTIDDVDLYAFKLPDEVKTIVEDLIKNDNSTEERKALANRTIYNIATLLFKDVIYCNNKMSDIQKDENRWVYSLNEFDIDLLKEKIKDWLKEEAKNIGNEVTKIEFKEKWEFEKINLKDIYRKEIKNYSIIPNYYIYILSKEYFDFTTLNKKLMFYRLVGETGGAEMFTLPEDLEINKIEEEKQYKDMLSYVIKAELKKPIDINRYVLNFKLSTRIWGTYPIIKKEGQKFKSSLTSEEALSVYIYKKNPYYRENNIVFNKLSILRNGSSSFKYKKTSDRLFADILDIDIKGVLFNPIKYLKENNQEEVKALCSKKNSKYKDAEYGPGLPERTEIIEIIENKLSNLKLREPIKFMSKVGRKKYGIFTTTDAEKYDFDKYMPRYYKNGELTEKTKELSNKAYKLNTNNKKMLINICTTENELVEMVIRATRFLLKLDKKDEIYINDDGLQVEFNVMDNDFALYIEDNEDKKDRVKKIKNIFKRDDNIIQTAIIDIERYDLLEEYEEKDSKYIIRNALKECHVISQFIDFVSSIEASKEKKLKATSIDTVLSSVKDLISACGFIEGEFYEITGLEKEDIILGVDKISTKDNSTRIGMSKVEKGIIYYKIYPDNEWKEMKECIYSINNKMLISTKIEKVDTIKREDINQWILDNVEKELQRNLKIYFYVNYSMRGIWKQVNNDNFLNFDQLILSNKKNLRFIRFNITDEVPDYFVYKKSTNNINKNTGIFKSSNSTYYLIGEKNEGNKVPNNLTKLQAIRKPIKRQYLCEINIQGTESEDEKDKIALMTQNLRRMNISYKLDASLPLPLYCFNRIGEYMISLLKTK